MRTIFGFNDKFTVGKEYVVNAIGWYVGTWNENNFEKEKQNQFWFVEI